MKKTTEKQMVQPSFGRQQEVRKKIDKISETKVWGKAEEPGDFIYRFIKTETIQEEEEGKRRRTEEDTILKSSMHKREMFKEE
jgi:hypothetical protein